MSWSRAVFSLNIFHSGRNPMRPSAGASRFTFSPFHLASAASSEPYFFTSQSPNNFSSSRSCASGMFCSEKVQKKKESSFCISRLATAASSTSGLPVTGLGVVSSAVHHWRYCAWNSGLKNSAANGWCFPS